MFVIDVKYALKLTIFFALVNSSVYIAYMPSNIIRLFISMFMNISGFFIIIFYVKIKYIKYDINLYFKCVLLFLLLWCCIVFFRAISLNIKSLISLFGHYLMGWAWLTVFAIKFGFRISNWIHLFDFFSKLLCFGSIISILAYFYYYLLKDSDQYVALGYIEWLVFFPILLMTYTFQKKTNQKILWVSVCSYLLMSYAAGQRINLIFLSIFVVFFVVERLRDSSMVNYKKIYLLFVIVVLNVIFMILLDDIYSEISNNETLTTDTRTFLFVELFEDMSNDELLIGRGALGFYYSPYFDQQITAGVEGGDWMYRQTNEVGYLQMILKGGYIMVFLHFLILFPAAYLGIFKSNNIIARMSGYYIVSYLIVWTVSYYSVYSAEYILLWMAAGTSISKSARRLTNSDLTIIKNKRLVFEK